MLTALKFANSKTRWRLVASPGDGWSTLDRAGTEDDDITEGTNPPGSAWRPVGKETVGGGYAIRQLSCVLRSLVYQGSVYVACIANHLMRPQEGQGDGADGPADR